MDSSTTLIFFTMGALMVGIYSWSRFDEPSYDSQSEHFARYKPRFATSYARYAWAKAGYIVAIVAIYLVFSTVPELFKFVGLDPGQFGSPPVIALAFITLQNVPGLKEMERRVRGMLHLLARIPEHVRRSVAQMRTSPFEFNPIALATQSRKLGINDAQLSRLIAEDDILYGWSSVGCLLWALSDKKLAQTGIDSLFSDYYKSELDSICTKHSALAELVRGHAASLATAPGTASSATDQNSALDHEVRDLRDRLCTFIACGVHSSVKNDVMSLEILRRLGFAIPITPRKDVHRLLLLAGLSFVFLVLLSIVTVFCTDLFREMVLLKVDSRWIKAFPVIPEDMAGLFLWSWSSAAVYLAVIMGALAIRNSRVIRHEWFDLNNLRRERPVLRYITPVLVGAVLGCFVLVIIAILGGPGFKPSFSDAGKAVGEALSQSFVWFPLPFFMALIAVMLSDFQVDENRFWRKAFVRAAAGVLLMTLVGFITTQMITAKALNAFAKEYTLEKPAEVTVAGVLLSLYIAGLIGLIVLALCIAIQVVERYMARARHFAGRSLEAVTRQGPEFCMLFDQGGAAHLFVPRAGRLDAASALCHGEWQDFPEGTAVRWDVESAVDRCKSGNFGLICSYGNSIIYEGYADQCSGTADFVGQVRFRNGTGNPVKQMRPTIVPPASDAPLQGRPVPLEPAMPAQQTGTA